MGNPSRPKFVLAPIYLLGTTQQRHRLCHWHSIHRRGLATELHQCFMHQIRRPKKYSPSRPYVFQHLFWLPRNCLWGFLRSRWRRRFCCFSRSYAGLHFRRHKDVTADVRFLYSFLPLTNIRLQVHLFRTKSSLGYHPGSFSGHQSAF